MEKRTTKNLRTEATSLTKRHTNYDAFAFFYNSYWSREIPFQILTVIERLLLPRLPSRHGRILDLCCGTGQVAAELTKRGFEVTGIDESNEMLRYARRNAPTARFITADVCRFKLPAIYHGAISTFDSLNHIMTLDELTAAFRNVHQALAEDGLFLFDINSEKGFRRHWPDYYSIIDEKNVCALRGEYDREKRIGRFEIALFRRKGKTWQRTDTTITEKCYPLSEIRKALKKAGFTKVSIYDAEKDLGLTEHTGRIFFLVGKN